MSAIVQKGATTPFVAGLRTRSRTIDLARKGEQAILIRVELAELWDAVKISASPNEPVVTIKRAALEAMAAADEQPEEFVIKLRGWEVLDEGASLADAGAVNGSIFLLSHRRRRPVR
jgi:hypothetical protein